jgi:hypothetical protein
MRCENSRANKMNKDNVNRDSSMAFCRYGGCEKPLKLNRWYGWPSRWSEIW